jgi:hypothetical protein
LIDEFVEIKNKTGTEISDQQPRILSLSTIVIDEFHMIGDSSPGRPTGQLLEIILSKLIHISKQIKLDNFKSINCNDYNPI